MIVSRAKKQDSEEEVTIKQLGEGLEYMQETSELKSELNSSSTLPSVPENVMSHVHTFFR